MNRISRIRTNLTRSLVNRIDSTSLPTLSCIAALLVVLFAAIYFVLSRYEIGLFQQGQELTFLDCLYFSVVTFTSLGYGDISPRSYGRLFASLEVIAGLSFLGLAVAKLSSMKQSYLIAQLYARDAQERLESYIFQIRSLRPAYEDAIKLLRRDQWPTPSLHRRHSEVYRLVLGIKGFISWELRNTSFLRDIPSGAFSKTFRALQQIASLVEQTASIPKTQHSQSQRLIAINVISEIQSLIKLIPVQDCDQSILSPLRDLSEKCEDAHLKLLTILRSVAKTTGSTLPKRFRA